MKKEIIKDQVFIKHYNGLIIGFPFSDLPKDILPSDIIDLKKTESYFSENNSWDAHTDLIVYRKREETYLEFAKREQKWIKKQSELRAERETLYEKLKKEFE